MSKCSENIAVMYNEIQFLEEERTVMYNEIQFLEEERTNIMDFAFLLMLCITFNWPWWRWGRSRERFASCSLCLVCATCYSLQKKKKANSETVSVRWFQTFCWLELRVCTSKFRSIMLHSNLTLKVITNHSYLNSCCCFLKNSTIVA